MLPLVRLEDVGYDEALVCLSQSFQKTLVLQVGPIMEVVDKLKDLTCMCSPTL